MTDEGFKAWFKAETKRIVEPLNADAEKLVHKIEERLQEFQDVSEKLAQEGKKEEERGRAVRKARVTEKLARYFLKQVERVTSPEEMSSKELSRFQNDLEKAVRSIEHEKAVWFPRISPLFIITRKRIDFACARLMGIVSEMKSFLLESYSRAEEVEEVFREADRVVELRVKLSTNIRSTEATELKLRTIEKEIGAGEQELNVVESSAELGNLVEVNQTIQQLRRQAKHEFRHLRKPFKKLVNLSRGSGYTISSEEAEKLDQLIEDPYIALATEKQGQPTLRNLLTKMEQAIEEGAIELKSSRLRKAQESIDAILNEKALANLQTSCAQFFSRSQDLASSKKTKVAKRKTKKIRIRLEQLKKQSEITAFRLERLKAEQERLRGKIAEQKEAVEESISSILEREVKIQL